MDSKVISYVESKIATANIFLVSKLKCPACVQAKALFKSIASTTGVFPVVFELHNYSKQQVRMIIKHLSARTRIKTVPQIFINGRFIGGNDDIQRIHMEGRLVPLIRGKSKIGITERSSQPSLTQSNVGAIKFTSSLTDLRSSCDQGSSNLTLMRASSEYSGLRKDIEAKSASWSLPGAYSKVDDNKWDMPLQRSTSLKMLRTKPSLFRSQSLTKLGRRRGNRAINEGSNNQRLKQKPHRSVPRTKYINASENWIADEVILNKPAVAVRAWRPREKGLPGEAILSCVV